MAKRLMHVTRLFVGLVFLAAGVNGYFFIFGFEPFIETSPEAMALFEFDYLLIVEKSLEILCGLLLLANRFLPLALAVLAPIVANIFLLHLFLDQSMLLLATVLLAAYGYLLYYSRRSFKRLLEKKPSPS
ncbi:DoxX family membrane protein [Domibacillus indicus]|uniref:DoxX family membrane protein n=1 Tax=Domibacillus indicus TaxID=1437523 RepID=UPI00061802C3|nr:DoxX family membrane protein [Domibacillus indicus]